MRATEVLRTTVENRQGRISIEAVVTDTATQRNRQVIRVEGNSGGGLLPGANALAKRIDGRASDFPTKNTRALQAFTAAAESTDAATRAQLLDVAIDVDPGFGLGYIALAETVAHTRDQNVAALLQTAGSHSPSFTPLDAARFRALSAQLSHAPLAQQESASAAVLQLAPNNLDALVALGSDRFLEGDAAGGKRFFGRALELSPENANIRNRLAEGLIETRRFGEAERILVGLGQNTAVLPELAVCILLEGDEARANAVADKFAGALNPDARQAYRAQWMALAGHLDQAIEALQGFHDRARGLLQIAIWQLMKKDFAGAKKSLGSATELPDGYRLFLYGHYSEAVEIWREVVHRSGSADLRGRAMLAASLDRAGKTGEARKIVVQPFIPNFGDLYAAISFNEMRRMVKAP